MEWVVVQDEEIVSPTSFHILGNTRLYSIEGWPEERREDNHRLESQRPESHLPWTGRETRQRAQVWNSPSFSNFHHKFFSPGVWSTWSAQQKSSRWNYFDFAFFVISDIFVAKFCPQFWDHVLLRASKTFLMSQSRLFWTLLVVKRNQDRVVSSREKE